MEIIREMVAALRQASRKSLITYHMIDVRDKEGKRRSAVRQRLCYTLEDSYILESLF